MENRMSMKNEALRTKVLAKCGDTHVGGTVTKVGDWNLWIGTGQKFILENKDGSIVYSLRPDAPESDPVWPLAAQILGIEERPERPSNTVLWAIWKAQMAMQGFSTDDETMAASMPMYREWLKALPVELLEVAPPHSLTEEIWWDGVRAQHNHKVYSNEKEAVKLFLKFMNQEHVIARMKGSPEPRPSNDLLWEAYKTGYHGCGSIERFNNFIAALPPDPLAADRELVYNDFFVPPTGFTKEPDWMGWGPEFREALRRLCGKGESNG